MGTVRWKCLDGRGFGAGIRMGRAHRAVGQERAKRNGNEAVPHKRLDVT
jgi:hypothetical protein